MTSLLCSALMYVRNDVLLNDVLLSDESFNITSSQDAILLEQLKEGLQKEEPFLESSLLRLAKMLKQLGYCDKLK